MMRDDYDPKYVKLCNVEWFNVDIDPTKVTIGELRALSVKVVEKAAEVMQEGKDCALYANKDRLKEELANTIQACCNLAAAFGIFDLRDAIDGCCERNTEQGRISKQITARQQEVLEFFGRTSNSVFTNEEDGV